MNLKVFARQTALWTLLPVVAAFLLDGFRPAISVGILIGAVLAVFKTRQYALLLRSLAEGDRAGAIRGALYGLSLLAIAAVLFFAVQTDMRLCAGIVAGILLPIAALFTQSIRLARGGN